MVFRWWADGGPLWLLSVAFLGNIGMDFLSHKNLNTKINVKILDLDAHWQSFLVPLMFIEINVIKVCIPYPFKYLQKLFCIPLSFWTISLYLKNLSGPHWSCYQRTIRNHCSLKHPPSENERGTRVMNLNFDFKHV